MSKDILTVRPLLEPDLGEYTPKPWTRREKIIIALPISLVSVYLAVMFFWVIRFI